MKLGFLDLIQSQFTLGLTVPNMNGMMLSHVPDIPTSILPNLPQQVHDFLAYVAVEELHTTYDDTAIIYAGSCRFDGSGKADATPSFKSSSGSFLQLQDLGFTFRVTIPRKSSAAIKASVAPGASNVGNTLGGDDKTDFTDFSNTLLAFDDTAIGAPSDFPNKDFRIELLFNTLTLHLPAGTFLPARMNDGWLVKDTKYDEVKIELPKIGLTITQTADNYNTTQVRFAGWGINNMEEGGDPAAGEMIRMIPSLCLHSSGVVGFGMEKIILDLSTDYTPPEILEKNFGIGDDFTGLWIPSVRLFVAPSGLKGFAVDTWAKDMLIDFEQGLSGEFGIEVLNGAAHAPLEVQSVFYTGREPQLAAAIAADAVTELDGHSSTERHTRIAIPADSKLQLRIRGGKAGYVTKVLRKDGFVPLGEVRDHGADAEVVAVNGDQNKHQWTFPANGNASRQITIYVNVTDKSGNVYEEVIQASLLPATTSNSGSIVNMKPPTLKMTNPGTGSGSATLAPAQPDSDAVFVLTNPSFATVKAGGQEISRNADGSYRIPCARDGKPVGFDVSWKDQALPPDTPDFTIDGNTAPKKYLRNHGTNFEYVYFSYDSPGGDTCPMENPKGLNVDSPEYIALAADYYLINATNLSPGEPDTETRLLNIIKKGLGKTLFVFGYASYEHHDSNANYNLRLSRRRSKTMISMLKNVAAKNGKTVDIQEGTAQGDTVAHLDASSFDRDPDYHVAVAFFEVPKVVNQPVTYQFAAEVTRPADEVTTVLALMDITPPPAPPERGPFFRRMATKVRFQRNKLVLAEVSGEFDFAKGAEQAVSFVQQKSNLSSGSSGLTNGITGSPGTSADNDHKGIVDFRLAMVYNEATRKLTQTLALGFDKENMRDGLLTLRRWFDGSSPGAVLQDTLSSLLVFAPLLNNGIDAAQSAKSGGDKTAAMVLGGAEVLTAAALGALAFKMDHITLFGAELSVSETSPDIWIGNASAPNEIGLILDYGVQFGINLEVGPLQIITRPSATDSNGITTALAPPFVRYKAIGFKSELTAGGDAFKPIFDTSKGYELSLGDPGALQVKVGGKDIGDLLKILSTRIARDNPFVLEMDLAFAVNLGVITVDTMRVSARIDQQKDENGKEKVDFGIMVIPGKVSVDIPGAIIGNGYLEMGQPNNVGKENDAQVHGGFRGHVDISLIPLKLRIAASLGIGPVSDGVRNATAFFLGLEVELPMAIPLGGTGLGIYGFLGLFGMHYKRAEETAPESGLPPALAWFEKVGGDVIDLKGWVPSLDHWSFGLGIILGTMEGGFVMNMKGMFMLELPGPRILIFVKAVMLFPKPDGVKGGDSAAGILAIIDLDFNIGKLTIGLIMEYEIESILSLRVPVDAEFNFNQPERWHVYIGSNKLPAEALILGIVRGYAYLMIGGDGIPDFPEPGKPQLLNGFSLAVGLGASIIFGDKDDDVYLDVSGDFKAGIGFSPLTIFGQLVLRGELHLWPVSISAHALLEVNAASQRVSTDPDNHETEFVTHIHGEACAKVDLVLFSVEGCVTVDIGTMPDEAAPAALVKGVTLVSRSSVLAHGQGTDRPIDGALGRALHKPEDPAVEYKETDIPTVSIDAIIAIDMVSSPDVGKATSFTDKLEKSPNAVNDYWMEGGDAKTKVRYAIESIELDHPMLETVLPRPASWWQQENQKDKGESGVSLALLSWKPDPTPHAVQQSEQLDKSLEHKWATSCFASAPAAGTFWTFNQKPLGYSTKGWKLQGSLWPDPPKTVRSTKPSPNIYVYEPFGPAVPMLNPARATVKGTMLEHAKVIGSQTISTIGVPYRLGRVLQLPVEHSQKRITSPRTPAAPPVAADLQAFLKAEETERVIVECQPIAGGNILLAIDRKTIDLKNIIFRAIGPLNTTLEESPASAFTAFQINSIADLPQHWKDPAGPWFKDAQLVMNFFATADPQHIYTLYLIAYVPATKPAKFSITAHPLTNPPGRKSVLLCALELTEASEISRQFFDQETQNTKQTTITSALEGKTKRALLKPGQTYTLRVKYNYERKRDNELLDKAPKPVIVDYMFKTDAAAPARLDPWVLGASPQNNMMHHFADDAVQLFFNDDSAFQLFEAYGHALYVKIRKNNGNHPVPKDADKMNLGAVPMLPNGQPKPADAEGGMSGLKGVIKSAFDHALEGMLDKLPCIDFKGDYEAHAVWTSPIELERNTGYTLEVLSTGSDTPGNGKLITPLYKLAFTTSRYRSMEELGGAVNNSYILPRALRSKLTALDLVCTDNQMQDALMTAGLDALEPAADARVIVLWEPVAGGHIPAAILIDTPEPLWRDRPYLIEETIKDDAGKDMTHWTTGDRPEMLVVKFSGPVQQIVHNLSGTRTLVYLDQNAGGKAIDLQLQKNFFVLNPDDYATLGNYETTPLLKITLPTLPPWADND